MPISDRFGLPLSTSSTEAAENYVAAVDLMLSANVGAEALLEDTFIAAPLRAGQYDRARVRLAERLQRRPSERDRRWLAQVQQVSN